MEVDKCDSSQTVYRYLTVVSVHTKADNYPCSANHTYNIRTTSNIEIYT
jgi:hypothetical protein